jgi:hypothetical protein
VQTRGRRRMCLGRTALAAALQRGRDSGQGWLHAGSAMREGWICSGSRPVEQDTCSKGQLKLLKDDLVNENSARSRRQVAIPGALEV